jgi:hypothetical protein
MPLGANDLDFLPQLKRIHGREEELLEHAW